MSEVAGAGRTVLFVSHNMGAVRSLCSRAIVIDGGKIIESAAATQAVEAYLQLSSPHIGCEWFWENSEMPGDETLRVERVSLTKSDGKLTTEVQSDERFQIKIQYEQRAHIRGLRISVQLVTQLGEIAFTTSDHSIRNEGTFVPGRYESSCWIPGKLLNIGQYTIRLEIDVPGVRVIQHSIDVGSFMVVGQHHGGTTFPDATWAGVVSPLCSWMITSISGDATTRVARSSTRAILLRNRASG